MCAPSANDGDRRLLVIGAGLGRTGTSSFREAMLILYPGQGCHHMQTVIPRPGESDRWRRMWLSGDEADLRALVLQENNVAACDWPSCSYYRQLAEMFPDAKVVLTLHPKGGEGWYKSVMQTIFFINNEVLAHSWLRLVVPPFRALYGMTCAMLWDSSTSFLRLDEWRNPEVAKKAYDTWNEQVQRSIPGDRLLVFKATDGWEPLCKFLGRPVPDLPFPNANDASVIRGMALRIRRLTYALPAAAVAFIAAILLLRKRRRLGA